VADQSNSREVDIRDSRGVRAGDRNVQYFIGTYIAQQGVSTPVVRRGGRAVTGEVTEVLAEPWQNRSAGLYERTLADRLP
jgi:hypothetical protein